MPNPRHSKAASSQGKPDKPRKAPAENMPMKTANWPGLPGPSQSKDRSGGVKKLKVHPKSEGL